MSQYNKISQGRLLQNPEPQMPTRYVDDNQYEMLMDAMNNPEKGHGVAWWVAVVVGVGLVIIPEPATTATGLTILGATFALGQRKK